MSNEEIVKEIDEATRLMAEARVKTNEALCHARNVVMNSKGNEEAYNKGLEDAWKFVTKTNTSVHPREAFRLLDFFGVANYRDIYVEYTPQEALAKLEAYEKEQNIKVGDVVETEDCNGVVIDQYADDRYYILTENGCVEDWCYAEIAKTGKHIDLTDLFKQIGGAE